MNNQKWIVATLAVLVAISCFAVPLLADTADADTPKKEGHGSGNGVTVSYVDSETDGYGIITLVIDRVPVCDYLTVRLDGTDSAPISIPADGRIVFATAGQLALGDHSVTVSWDGFRSNIVLSVGYQGEGDAVTGVTLDIASKVMLVGTTMKLTAGIQPVGATGYIVWATSDASVATVDDGTVTAVAAGEAVITAKCGNCTASCTVTVKTGEAHDVDTEVVDGDSVITTTGTEVVFDDGTSIREVEQTVDNSVFTKEVTIITETDAAGNSVTTESGTVTMKDSDVVLDVSRTSTVSGTVETSSMTISVTGSNVSTTATEVKAADGTVQRTSVTTVDAAVTTSEGKATVTVDAATLAKVSDQTAAVASQISDVKPVVEINAKSASQSKDSSIVMPKDSLTALADTGNTDVKIDGDVVAMSFSSGALKKICESSGSEVNVSTKVLEVSDLSESDRKMVGDNVAVFELSVSVGESAISQFGEGNKVKVSLPYTLKSGEKALDVKVWCLTPEGLEEYECTYADGAATFETTHLSIWVVGTSVSQPGENSDEGLSGWTLGLIMTIVAFAEAGVIWIVVSRKR